MRFRASNLDEANPSHSQANFTANQLNDFAKILHDYRAKTKAKLDENATAKAIKHSETNIASNELAQFFRALGFESQIAQSTNAKSANSAIDLALLQNGAIKVIIEAKLPESLSKSKAQMFSAQNPNCKALHEAILYYLREVVDRQNFGVESIIITDFTRFFIFNYKEFERIFAKNAKIKDIFAKFKNDTSNFYAKAQGILDSLDDEIRGVCVDLEHFDKSTLKSKFPPNILSKNNKSLEKLYGIFHKDFLFGEFRQSNPLSPRFYNELLYILGLSEYNRSGKITIEPSKESLSRQNTLYHLITTQIDSRNLGDSKDIDFVMQFVILWLNRILFLKLIEANLMRFNDDKNLSFLNKSKLKDYQALSHLFFEVLAKEHTERKDSPLIYLPYLNSSLFERHKCEEMLDISMLDNEAEFFYYDTTQVRKDGKKQAGKVNLLTYIFEFLDAFDFGGKNCDEVIEQKELIKTNVLGLVFEKLNGYKEGSFYTPNFITSYMCRVSLEKVILDKFNSANPKWNATNLSDLATLIRDERERKDDFKRILREIHICDPAVGSGHFLVSTLCEMVRIYHNLRLSDELNEYELKIDNDEIIVYVENGRIFEYKKPTKPNDTNQSIQKSLFHLKKSIIENNLFGVDINPNSVEICKLRLWIELLKNSYYLRDSSEGFSANLSDSIHQMQTLPNIDINIKCGNSLVSNFAFDSTFAMAQTKDFAQNLKATITAYKAQVALYKEALTQKRAITSEIHALKELLKNYLIHNSSESKRLRENLRQFVVEYGENHFDIDSTFGLEMLRIIRGEQKKKVGFKFQPTMEQLEPKAIDKKAVDLLSKIKADFEILQSFNSGNALEWRFEFPEVLDNNGDFMGFDLIVGNPPYIRQEEIKELKPHLQESFSIYSGTSDIYTYFYERSYNLLRQGGILSLITSNKFCRAGYGANLRAFLLQSTAILDFVDLNGVKVFDKATVDTCIVNAVKSKPTKSHTINYANPNAKDLSALVYSQIAQDSLSSEAFIFADSPTLALKQKIEQIGTPLKEWDIEIYRGVLTGYNEAFIIDTATKDKILDSCESAAEKERTAQIIKPILRGRDIKRYSYEWAGLWIINTHNGYSLPNGEKIPRIDIDNYSALKKHLDKFYPQLQKRTDKGATPYNLRNCAYVEVFEKEKISWQRVTQEPSFIVEKDFYLLDSMAFLVSNSKQELRYLLAFLNSKAVFWYFKNIGHLYSDKGFLLSNQYVSRFPIPKITAKNRQTANQIIKLVDKVLQSKAQGKDSSESESQIDDLVYKLYNLDSNEIQIIRGN